ncbi:ParB/RepB/Spo0J family partition protein [Micrococcus sp.]|uniref:ParB/RepB/Spo0J family partition protein n=1 Tax=Micrococcus sp. TaxID=1271 RepID=UPI002A90B08D|nr:ParB/RepB/Spo0J family partition protein [Micrococcus sp.]MDY6054558.1 ParB/RepB/Spo0J family partition protein [Micrococcus sp.]
MKSSRRGGLGRGLGALIQSTAELPIPSDKAAGDSAATAAASQEASTTAAAPLAGEGTTSQPAPQSGEKPRKATKSSKSSTAAAPAPTDADTASQESVAVASTELATSAEPATPEATAAPSPASSTRTRQRPADIFFTSTDPAAQEASQAGGTAQGRRTGAAARPAMPTISAPSRRRDRAEVTESAPAPENTSTESATPTEAGQATGTSSAAPTTTTPGIVSPDIAVLREIPVGEIHPNPRQPREVFDEEHMAELVTSIQEVGVLQPVVVREASGPTPYELIMGERRWRASQLAGRETIPAIVRQTPDHNLLRDALLENLHRSQLNPLEEAAAYQQLMEDFSCTQEELSQRIGRSRPQISNTLRLLRLPPLVQRRVAAGTLSAGHARALLGLTEPAEMERLAQRVVSEGLSVRATEDAVAQLQGAVRPAPRATRTRDDARHERLDYFANALTSKLDTQVKITLGARKGKIAIDFTSVEDLNRIMDLIQGDRGQD